MKFMTQSRKHLLAILFFAVLVMSVFWKTDISAAVVYDEIKVETVMLVGDEERYTSIRWIQNGDNEYESISGKTTVMCSNPSVLRAEVVKNPPVTTYGSSYYTLKLDALQQGKAAVTVRFGDRDQTEISFEVEVIGREQAVIQDFPTDRIIKRETDWNSSQIIRLPEDLLQNISGWRTVK